MGFSRGEQPKGTKKKRVAELLTAQHSRELKEQDVNQEALIAALHSWPPALLHRLLAHQDTTAPPSSLSIAPQHLHTFPPSPKHHSCPNSTTEGFGQINTCCCLCWEMSIIRAGQVENSKYLLDFYPSSFWCLESRKVSCKEGAHYLVKAYSQTSLAQHTKD